MTFGFLLILSGMLKKLVIATTSPSSWSIPSSPTRRRRPARDLIAAHYAYAMQVYCDFSAYSDIAIGTAPCSASSSARTSTARSAPPRAQFWQRWHISLSTWLRDYLYRALRGGKRDHGSRMYRNMFLTMLLGGLWHGADWTFVIWGAIHGVGCAPSASSRRSGTPSARRASPAEHARRRAVGDVPNRRGRYGSPPLSAG